MPNVSAAAHLADHLPQVALQALLAHNLTSFTEFAFGVVRPGIHFKPNWHFEAVTHKLSQVAAGASSDYHLTTTESEIAVRISGAAGLVPRPQSQ
jgi:hypothetical protein